MIAVAVDVRRSENDSGSTCTPDEARWAATRSPRCISTEVGQQVDPEPEAAQPECDVRGAPTGMLEYPAIAMHDVDEGFADHEHVDDPGR